MRSLALAEGSESLPSGREADGFNLTFREDKRGEVSKGASYCSLQVTLPVGVALTQQCMGKSGPCPTLGHQPWADPRGGILEGVAATATHLADCLRQE